MGWAVLLVLSPRHFSSSSSSHTLLLVLVHVVLGCADGTCAAVMGNRSISSCQSPSGRQMSHPWGCSAPFPQQHEPFSLCSPSCLHLAPACADPQGSSPTQYLMLSTNFPAARAQCFQGENSRQPVFALRAASNH